MNMSHQRSLAELKVVTTTPQLGTLLLRTPRPFHRESLMPFALRVSRSNGYPSPAFLFQKSPEEQFDATKRLDPALVKAGVHLDQHQLDRLRYRFDEDDRKHARLLGQLVRGHDLNIARPRVCPDCIKENGHMEALWDLAWVTCCPIHKRTLVDRCPECSVQLTWTREKLGKCQRGHSLSLATPVAASWQAIALSCLFAQKLYGNDDPTVRFRQVLEQSNVCDLSLIEICEVVTGFINQMKIIEKSRNRSRKSLLSTIRVMNIVGDLLFGTGDVLDGVFDYLSKDSRTGNRHVSFYRPFRWVFRIFPIERRRHTALTARLLDYAKYHWPACRIKSVSCYGEQPIDVCKWMTPPEAAKVLGLVIGTVTNHITLGKVPYKRMSEKTNHCYLIPTEWVVNEINIPEEKITRQRLKALTGMTVYLINELRRRNLFISSIKAGRNFFTYDVDRFIGRLLDTTAIVGEYKLPSEISFCELLHRGTADEKLARITAVLDGTLTSTRKLNVSGLHGLLFDKKAVLIVKSATMTEIPLHHAELYFGCHFAHALALGGYLTKGKKWSKFKYVTIDSVKAFQENFESPRRLLDKYNIKTCTLLDAARFAMIKLASVRAVNRAGHIWFLPRDKIPALETAIPQFLDVKSALAEIRRNERVQRRRMELARKTSNASPRKGIEHLSGESA